MSNTGISFVCCWTVSVLIIFALIGCEAKKQGNNNGANGTCLVQEMPVRIIIDARGMDELNSEHKRRIIDDPTMIAEIMRDINSARLCERGTDAQYIGRIELKFDSGREPVRIDYFGSRLMHLDYKSYKLPEGGWLDKEVKTLRELEESENSETETTE